jgi:hypothetical protein
MGDIDHFKNLFAWTGMVYMFGASQKEDIELNRNNLQQLMLQVFQDAKNYTGNDPQFIIGYQEILESLPLFTSFYPELQNLLDNPNLSDKV